MQILWAAVKGAIWCKDSAKAWGASWGTFGLAELQKEPWLGKLALLLGIIYTALRIYREWLQIRVIKRDEAERKNAVPIVMIAILSLFMTGCGLIPKRVEYFQRKVEAVPQKPAALVEAEKQGAELAARLAWSAQVAAHAEQASTNVLNPLDGLAVVSKSVSGSLGQPESKWSGEPTSLADRLDTRNARLDAKLEDYAASVQRDVGKKIEGTGLFRIPWIINGALWIGIPLALFWVARMALNIWNPVIGGVVGQAERVGVDVVRRGFGQVIAGVESFKAKVDAMDLDDKAKAAIKGLLREKLTDNQDSDVQAAIKKLAN